MIMNANGNLQQRITTTRTPLRPYSRTRKHRSKRWSWVGGLLAVVVAGCEPVSESERTYFETRDQELEEQRQFMQTMTDANTMENAINMVKKHASPTENTNTEAWINNALNRLVGDVMFPKWDARRLGPNRFEVMFTYTHIDREYTITRGGYAWEVDTLLKVVSDPRELASADLEPQPRWPAVELKDDVITPEAFSLE